jgi:hypothetical protein
MGDNIYNLPIDEQFNPNESDIKLVSYIFKDQQQPAEGVTQLNINKNTKERSFSKDLTEGVIAGVLFMVLSLPQVTPIFDRLAGEEKPMYSVFIRVVLFIILFVYIKRKL